MWPRGSVLPHTLSLAALAARVAEAAFHLQALRAAADLRERWEAIIAGRRAPSALLDLRGRVIASRGVTGLPSRLDLTGLASEVMALPGGRVAELEPFEGGGCILWLRRRSRVGASCVRMRLLGRDASVELGMRCELRPKARGGYGDSGSDRSATIADVGLSARRSTGLRAARPTPGRATRMQRSRF
jgi:hypothetical protein